MLNKKLSTLLLGAALSAVPFMSHAQIYASSTTTAGCGIPTSSVPGFSIVNGADTGPSHLYTDTQFGSPYFGYVFYLYAESTFPPSNESITEPGGVTELAAEEAIEADCGLALLPGGNDSYFGPDNTVLDVEFVRAPFDAGLSLLLGAGVIAGVKRARNRKAQVA